MRRNMLGFPQPKNTREPLWAWAMTCSRSIKYHGCRKPSELFIMQERARELKTMQSLDDCAHWGANPSHVARLLKTTDGFLIRRNQINSRNSTKVKRQRMGVDPEYAQRKRAIARASYHRRGMTDEQHARRLENERRNYHERHKHNPRWKAEHNLRVRLNKFIKGVKTVTMRELMGCSRDTLVLHLEKQFVRGMTWKNYGTVWHIDHIAPCSSFDLKRVEDQRRCFHMSNLRPMWAAENKSKGARIVTHQPQLLLQVT